MELVRRSLPRAVSSLLGAALLFAASRVGAAPVTKSCALLTRSEIKAAFGQSVAKPTTNAGSCFWDIGGGLGRKGGQLQAAIERGPMGVTDFQDSQSPASTPVTGVGDQAFLDGEELQILKGDAYVTLTGAFSLIGRGPSESALHARLIRLAKQAVKRV